VPVRATVDIERPVPLTPLTVETEIVRPGRKVQVARSVLSDEDDNRLATASVVAIRRAEVDLPDDLVLPDDQQPPGPDTVPARDRENNDWNFGSTLTAYHQDATDH